MPGGSKATNGSVLARPARPLVSFDRAVVMRRAEDWVREQVPYSQTKWWTDANGTYRQDCSGYVSMAWGLDPAANDWTGSLPTVAYKIPNSWLQPGDILLSKEHVVLFAGWADPLRRTFNLFEEAHTGTTARYVTGASLQDFSDGGFLAYRYEGASAVLLPYSPFTSGTAAGTAPTMAPFGTPPPMMFPLTPTPPATSPLAAKPAAPGTSLLPSSPPKTPFARPQSAVEQKPEYAAAQLVRDDVANKPGDDRSELDTALLLAVAALCGGNAYRVLAGRARRGTGSANRR
ncbi:hypothetical protein [Kitasatospora sp. GAS204B]|uniref:hypothetical protein n=1 Tax=unclassified Kitasatospora TaxID=2633591 RepID=UPI00247564F9|nr:hypothetical protein [Kitasatospora sp. GAS204B]MDH6119781.1 hypothetical protein [Kitasatospora sp. GAS204B]